MEHTVDLDLPCIPWNKALDADGYGRAIRDGKSKMAHRVVYEEKIGPIPEDLQIDHLCRNRGCVRVEHMEVVTLKENVLRGEGYTAVKARQTRCIVGHPLEGNNLRVLTGGGRECKECSRRRWREYRLRKMEAGTWTKT